MLTNMTRAEANKASALLHFLSSIPVTLVHWAGVWLSHWQKQQPLWLPPVQVAAVEKSLPRLRAKVPCLLLDRKALTLASNSANNTSVIIVILESSAGTFRVIVSLSSDGSFCIKTRANMPHKNQDTPNAVKRLTALRLTNASRNMG